jgi:hypothetical protein
MMNPLAWNGVKETRCEGSGGGGIGPKEKWFILGESALSCRQKPQRKVPDGQPVPRLTVY